MFSLIFVAASVAVFAFGTQAQVAIPTVPQEIGLVTLPSLSQLVVPPPGAYSSQNLPSKTVRSKCTLDWFFLFY